MERHSKRPRLSFTTVSPDAPTDFQLHVARAQNDLRLKSVFEGIFEKYERDFTDEADEIDLQTGKIIVNKGHVLGIGHEDAPKANRASWLIGAQFFQTGKQVQGDTAQDGHHDDDDDDVLQRGMATREDGSTRVQELEQLAVRSPPLGLRKGSTRTVKGDAEDDEDGSDDDASFDDLLGMTDTVPRPSKQLCTQSDDFLDPGETDTAIESRQSPETQPSGYQPACLKEETPALDPKWRTPDNGPRFARPDLHVPEDASWFPAIPAWPVSPPGAGSLWALPRSVRRKSDLADKEKRKTATKKKMTEKKRSSLATCDWSFAEVPDGDESDDPLQEDCQPSPMQTSAIKAHNDDDTSRSRLADPISCRSSPTKEQLSSPTTNKRVECPMTPDETRHLLVMRHVRRKKWKEIIDFFRGKKMQQLMAWYSAHWTERCENPPPISKAWSKMEKRKLEGLRSQNGLSWDSIQAEFPDRSLAEIEMQLLRLWVEHMESHIESGQDTANAPAEETGGARSHD